MQNANDKNVVKRPMSNFRKFIGIVLLILFAGYVVFAVYLLRWLIDFQLRHFLPIIFIAMNCVANCILAYFMWRYLSPRIRKSTWKLMLFIICFGTFMPIFGTLILIIGVALSRWYGWSLRKVKLVEAEHPEFIMERPENIPVFGEGGAAQRLAATHLPTKLRIQSLSALSLKSSGVNNRLIQEVTNDKTDEVRLYAFNLLEDQENTISDEIHLLLKMIKADKYDDEVRDFAFELLDLDEKQRCQGDEEMMKQVAMEKLISHRVRITARLANLYWDLYYLNLAQDQLLIYNLDQADKYTSEALENNKDDEEMIVLKGRILMAQKKIDEAEKYFLRAKELNVSESKVIPYLANIAFLQKNYEKVRAYFKDSVTLQDIGPIAPVVKYWTENARKS